MKGSLAVLGPLRVTGPDGPVRLAPAQRRLLSIVLLEPEGELDRDVLIDRMWGERPPATARTALHVHVSGLRRALPGLIETLPAGYRLELDGCHYDRSEFERLSERAVAAARAGEWAGALEAAAAALEWWGGSPFDELKDDDYASPTIQRLADRWLDLLELHARAAMAVGHIDEAADRLSELVLRHPLREPLWEQLMLALYRSGRRAEALRRYEEVRRILAEELDVEPGSALRELRDGILAGDPALGESAAGGRSGSLPWPATSFVGRDEELRRLTELVLGSRVTTIVGGPGFGKTRLAIETGHALAERTGSNVWFVSLAEARNPLEVMGAITAATGLRGHVRTLEEVVKHLARRPAVLILDNCEHQLQPCARLVAQSLSSAAELRFLITSRQPLGVEDEQIWRIGPLAAPPDAPSDGDGRVHASPAVILFLDRARAVDRGFRLTSQTAEPVAELCRRAGGIPLALELAARWVPALGLDDIGEMLDGEPPGTRPSGLEHHRSLAAAIEWSMALLPPQDRRLFLRSSVFNGRFSLHDIRAVCAPDQEPHRLARAVAGLADASLIMVERQPDGAAMYRMLAPFREVARARFGTKREVQATRERFVSHYVSKSYGEDGDPLQQVIDLDRVDRDIDNLRQAWELGLGLDRADVVARQIVRLDGYFLNRYLIAQRSFWLERALERIDDPLTRAHVLRSLGSGAQVLSELEESLVYFHQALALFRLSDDRSGLAQCLLSLSGLLAMRGEWAEGVATAREARGLAAELHSTSGLAIAAYYVGENLAYGGDVMTGLAELENAARLFEKAGEIGRASYAVSTRTSVAVLAGRDEEARHDAPRALALAEVSRSVYRRVRALGASALLEGRYGDAEAAQATLLELHGLLEPYEMDDIFLFLLPSAFLLRRWRRWDLLSQVLVAAEAAIGDKGVAYPRPWKDAVTLLKQSAAETAGRQPAGSDLRRPVAGTLEQVSADVLSALREPHVA